MSRNLVSIRIIGAINPHLNADKLELATVDGWVCVVKKDDFKVGDHVIYFEIDSFIPTHVAPFLTKEGKQPREYEGIKGERLRTMRLRGELSQGLIMGLDVLFTSLLTSKEMLSMVAKTGSYDVTEILGVKKWEKPINPQLAGLARGNFPAFIQKTDQERIQNIFHKLTKEQIEDTYEVTLKLDGSSATYFVNDGITGVCSRNLELKTDEGNEENSFVKKFYELDLASKLTAFNLRTGRNIAVQGELWGSGINGNWEGISDHRYNVFDIYDIDRQGYVAAVDRAWINDDLGVTNAPVLNIMTLEKFKTVGDFLEFAERGSIHNKVAEGVVFQSMTKPDFSFKVISNSYLMGGGE